MRGPRGLPSGGIPKPQDAAGDLQFHLTPELIQTDVVAVQTLVRRRVLSLFERKSLLTPEAAENMRQWQNGGGFSFGASVVIDASDRAGLERLRRGHELWAAVTQKQQIRLCGRCGRWRQ